MLSIPNSIDFAAAIFEQQLQVEGGELEDDHLGLEMHDELILDIEAEAALLDGTQPDVSQNGAEAWV